MIAELLILVYIHENSMYNRAKVPGFKRHKIGVMTTLQTFISGIKGPEERLMQWE
jgi:hypothetical protein